MRIIVLFDFPEAAVGGVWKKKGVLKILQNSQENTCNGVSFLIKLQFITSCYPVNYAKFLGAPFTEHFRTTTFAFRKY